MRVRHGTVLTLTGGSGKPEKVIAIVPRWWSPLSWFDWLWWRLHPRRSTLTMMSGPPLRIAPWPEDAP